MSEITLNWNASPGPISGYNVYRGTSATNQGSTPLNSMPIAGLAYIDTTVLPGLIYYYEITAVYNGVESADSTQVTSDPVPFPAGPALISLAAAESFVVLAATTVTNVSGTPTTASGDVGVSPGTSITGFGTPAAIAGVFHSGDFVSAAAQGALSSAYADAAGRTGATTMTADIGGQTLLQGVYNVASSLAITGTLVLDAQGNPNATWIFQIGSTLTTAASNSHVVLIGGAQACNVFWQVGSSATLGVNTTFAGTIMAQVSITVDTGVSLDGRVLARTGAVTLDTNSITAFQSCVGHPLPPSGANVPPTPPAAPGNPRIVSEA